MRGGDNKRTGRIGGGVSIWSAEEQPRCLICGEPVGNVLLARQATVKAGELVLECGYVHNECAESAGAVASGPCPPEPGGGE